MIGRTIAHYEVLSELGVGGMGVVYLAEDKRLKRKVALKLLRPDTAADESRMRRFEQEAQIVAALNHPGIVTLFSVEEHEGLRFLTMELVEGEPLHDLIPPEGLPIARLLAIALPLVEAMAAAHGRGVTHRDLKPGNVFVTPDGRVKVLDFGLAKLREPASGAPFAGQTATTMLTQEGAVLGTVAYMSPEQAEGRPLGPPSDVFSLGIILYEMATGRRPFTGDSHISILSAVLRDDPALVTDTRRDLPAQLAVIVERCLAKDPDDRYPSAIELLSALRDLEAAVASGRARPAARLSPRRWAAIAAALAVAAVGGWLLATRAPWSAPGAATSAGAAPVAGVSASRVLVLPFTDRTGDPRLGSVGLMAADWLTQGLSSTGRLEVVPMQARLPAGEPSDPAWLARVGRETGAGTVVAGAYYLQGDTLQLAARLYDTANGKLLVAVDPIEAPREGATAALEALRQRVMGNLASFIDPELGPVAKLVSRPPSFAAYESFLAGMERYTAMDFRGALAPLKEAAAADPDYVTPLLMAATAHYNLGEYGEAQAIVDQLEPRREDLPPLDRYNLEWLGAECRGDRAIALRASQRAAELSPRSLWTYRYGLVALRANRAREAQRAMASLDPERGFVRGWVSFSYHYASTFHYLGDHAGELAEAERVRRANPNSLGALSIEMRARAALGDVAGVERLADESLTLAPEWLATPGMVMMLGGRELTAHGQAEAARRMTARSIAWYRRLAPAEAAQPLARLTLANALIDAGELEEAASLVAALAAEQPDDVAYRGLAGVLAARRGDRAAAEATELWLAELDRPFLFGEHLYWRAAIAAWSDRPQEALDLLREAHADGRPFHWGAEEHAHVDPMLAPLRDEPSFATLVTPQG